MSALLWFSGAVLMVLGFVLAVSAGDDSDGNTELSGWLAVASVCAIAAGALLWRAA